jgi:hypothetical protein
LRKKQNRSIIYLNLGEEAKAALEVCNNKHLYFKKGKILKISFMPPGTRKRRRN